MKHGYVVFADLVALAICESLEDAEAFLLEERGRTHNKREKLYYRQIPFAPRRARRAESHLTSRRLPEGE